MVGGKRTRRARRQLLGSHQKCWLWGRHVVLETLRAGRWKPLEIWAAIRVDPHVAREVRLLALSAKIPLLAKTVDEITRRCGTAEHQGLLAKMPPFPYRSADELFNRRVEWPCYVVLDALQDPYNFGALLRSADAFAMHGVFVGTQRQSGVTALVARTSAGAINHVPLAQVDDLVAVVGLLRRRGVSVVAASEKGQRDVCEHDFRRPSALIIGNEGAGIRDELLAQCDALVRIPQFGVVGSLNAAVAAGILFYEVRRQTKAVAPRATRSPPDRG